MEGIWKQVQEYANLENYHCVNSITDVQDYRPLKFLILPKTVFKWWNPFRKSRSSDFDPVGEIENFAKTTFPGHNSLPKIQVEKIGVSGKEARIESNLEGQAAAIEGSLGTSTALHQPALGKITRHKVKYRDLRAWVEKYWFLDSAEDMEIEARGGKLFIIHEVLMAEKLHVKATNDEKRWCEIHSSSLKSKSSNTLDFERPSEFGDFPLAYKVAKIKASRVKHAAHHSTASQSSTNISVQPCPPSTSSETNIPYRLKLEPLRDFSTPCSRRNLNKENSSSSSDDSVSPPTCHVCKRKIANKETGNKTSEPKARRCLDRLAYNDNI